MAWSLGNQPSCEFTTFSKSWIYPILQPLFLIHFQTLHDNQLQSTSAYLFQTKDKTKIWMVFVASIQQIAEFWHPH